MTPSNRSTHQRDGITLTMTLVTEPQYLAESLALALNYDQNHHHEPDRRHVRGHRPLYLDDRGDAVQGAHH